jgi:hypothetical protein
MKEKLEEKLKSVLHIRKKSTPTQSPRASYEHPEERSPRAEHYSSSPTHPRQPVSEYANHDSRHAGRSRPLSSSHDDGRANNTMTSPTARAHHSQAHSTDINGSIADDYKSYLPVLDSVDDSNTQQHATLGGDRRLVKGGNEGIHGEHVVDRNTARYRASSDADRFKPLPTVPKVPSSQREPGAARDDAQLSLSKRRPQDSEGEGEAPQPPPHKFIGGQNVAVEPTPGLAITTGRQHVDGGQDWKAKQRALLEGVVDLKNTVDMERDVQTAPGKLLLPSRSSCFGKQRCNQ